MTLTVIIPVYNSSRLLEQTLLAVTTGTRVPDELIVVDDNSTDESAEIGERFGASVLVMPHNIGPAACRNHAATLSRGDVLVFLDADTCAHPDTLKRMEVHLLMDPGLSAVIGSYDDTPRDPGLCSQYRNLAHCYVHQSSNRAALTFWSGCGAVRRGWFFAVDGFDERYRRPSVEDIELGYRMTDRGARVLLDPEIRVTHTKRWTIWNSVTTDIRDRGIPWMVLLLQRGRIPNDLNIKLRHRVATVLTGLALVCLLVSVQSPLWLLSSAVLAAIALCLDAGLLRFIYRKRGWRLLAFASAMTLIQNVCKLVATGAALLAFAKLSRPPHSSQQEEHRSSIQESRKRQEARASEYADRRPVSISDGPADK